MATKRLRPRTAARRAVVGTAAIATLALLAGCSAGSAAPASDGEPSGKLEILVSSADASDAAFKAINEAFEKKYPDVDVTFSSVSNDNYPATKSSRLTAGNVDIIVLKTFVEVPDYAKDSTSDDVLLAQAGGLVDLTDEDFMSNYTPSVLDAQAIGGKQYAVPTGLSYSTGVYYNKKIFEDNGLAVPTTWSELVKAMSTLTDAGVAPFGIGGKDTWPAGLAMLGSVAGLYPTADAKAQLAKNLWTGKAKLTDDVPEEVLEKTETIFQNAQDNFAGAGYDAIPAGFAAGDFAMTIDGTWNEPTIESAVNGAFDFGYFPLPTSDNAEDNAFLNGKIELQLGVASSTKNKTAALAWLDFFSDPKNYADFLAKSGFSSAQPDIPATPFLESIEKYTSTYQPAWDQVWIANNKAGQDAVYPFNYPALQPLGSSSAEKAASAAQSAWSAAF
ncbi:carbohydrate ABC transporter substrate-binding protein, CUT1 family [Paramicrobacterium humi]|uniref:Carbohydrate ABC transporter substrate-binding protein, CUT1 family n=1 Tax=Paramicrobacterium humi TaxID=640635 RepID=A0A1H4KPU6_9MICO|nr:extracellular solute-binding protein [Microbacterium humi]SEB60413.1 carbohydrate ABC transporter substrate-binding protein, CUT1 family [Microbacterium humi]